MCACVCVRMCECVVCIVRAWVARSISKVNYLDPRTSHLHAHTHTHTHTHTHKHTQTHSLTHTHTHTHTHTCTEPDH